MTRLHDATITYFVISRRDGLSDFTAAETVARRWVDEVGGQASVYVRRGRRPWLRIRLVATFGSLE